MSLVSNIAAALGHADFVEYFQKNNITIDKLLDDDNQLNKFIADHPEDLHCKCAKFINEVKTKRTSPSTSYEFGSVQLLASVGGQLVKCELDSPAHLTLEDGRKVQLLPKVNIAIQEEK